MSEKLCELIGKRFGRLVMVGIADDYISSTGGVHKRVLCKCDCGKHTVVHKEHLLSSATRSCGCLRKNSGRKIHQEIHTKLYRIWGNMCNRCSNPNNPAWGRYGGRGIFVCDEWKKYESFRDWAKSSGYEKSLTIDRIDNNKGYNPENCRWASVAEQNNNKSNNHYVEYNSMVKTIAQWSKETNIPYKLLHHRIVGLKWDIHKALTQKPRRSPIKNS